MAERALAHVEKIEWIRPIEGAYWSFRVGLYR